MTALTDPRAYVLISPCRNESAYMRRTLDSVVAQTLTPALWVIVDDGSTDGTPDVARRHATRPALPNPASLTSILICRRGISRH